VERQGCRESASVEEYGKRVSYRINAPGCPRGRRGQANHRCSMPHTIFEADADRSPTAHGGRVDEPALFAYSRGAICILRRSRAIRLSWDRALSSLSRGRVSRHKQDHYHS
jgi:hypothetical protein